MNIEQNIIENKKELIALYLGQHKIDRAIKLCKECLADYPYDNDIKCYYCSALHDSKQYIECIELGNNLPLVNEWWSLGAHFCVALSYFYLEADGMLIGGFDRSIELLKSILKIDKDYSHAHSMLGIIYLYCDKYDEMLESITKAVELGSGDDEFTQLVLLQILEHYEGSDAQSSAYLHTVLQLFPDMNHKTVKEIRAKIAIKDGDYKEALEIYKGLFTDYPTNKKYIEEIKSLEAKCKQLESTKQEDILQNYRAQVNNILFYKEQEDYIHQALEAIYSQRIELNDENWLLSDEMEILALEGFEPIEAIKIYDDYLIKYPDNQKIKIHLENARKSYNQKYGIEKSNHKELAASEKQKIKANFLYKRELEKSFLSLNKNQPDTQKQRQKITEMINASVDYDKVIYYRFLVYTKEKRFDQAVKMYQELLKMDSYYQSKIDSENINILNTKPNISTSKTKKKSIFKRIFDVLNRHRHF